MTITDGATGRPIRETTDGLRDPSATEKDAAERKWQAALLQFWREQLERIEIRLTPGIPKSRKALSDLAKRLDRRFWDNEDEELLAVLLPLTRAGAVDGVQIEAVWLEAAYGITVDWTLPNAEAVEWARRHAGQLIKGVNETTLIGVRGNLSVWLDTPGATMGELYSDLETMYGFSGSRARMIATTEVTESYEHGHELGYEAAGFPAVAYAPPAHPNGRCWTVTEMLPNGEFVIVWRTNNDPIVCTRPLSTPWGEVAGCQALANVIVSEGRWLGRLYSEAAKEAREEN